MARRPLIIPTELEQQARTFLHNRDAEADAQARKNAARDILKGWGTLTDANGKFVNGDEDDNGNRMLPWNVNGKQLLLQKKSPAPYIDMDKTEALLHELDPTGVLYDKVFKREVIRTFHEDELFVLNQTGVISDEALDALEVQGDPSYSLTVVDAE